jgi:exopolysaccharide biosynthesis polyprenyl glycosylphosphotransferase
MKKLRSAEKMLVLQMSFWGLVAQTCLYAYFWLHVYYFIVNRRLKFYFRGHILMFAIYFVVLVLVTNLFGGTKVGYLKNGDIIMSNIFSLLMTNIISYFQISLMANWVVKIWPMVELTFIQIAFAVGWTYLQAALYKKAFPPLHMLLIHGSRPIENILYKFGTRKDKYSIDKCIDIAEGDETVKKEVMNGYNAIVLWDIPAMQRNKLYKFIYSRGLRIYMMPKITDVLVQGSDQLHLFDTPILMTKEYALTTGQKIAKRILDLVFAFVLLILASPFMLITAVIIKCYDGGPILYKQVRCTINRQQFKILKFRSMRVDAEKDGVARLAQKNDDRITPVGKFIRKTRIDELPQLFNIIKGEMSFIGPRPERPEIIDQYMEEMPEFAFRMRVKAGLAGYAQVYGKYNTTPYDKLKLDLTYIENYSVGLDFKLLLLTMKIVLKPESTEGVDASQITAMKQEEKKEDES